MSRMIDRTGLDERLRQHSQRSGMLVGLSMGVAVVLVFGAFVWLFFRLDPLFSDFAGRTGVARSTAEAARVVASPRTSVTPSVGTTVGNFVPPTPTALAGAPQRVATPTNFAATHVITDFGQQVNLRAGPSTTAARVAVLEPGARLQYLGEQERVGEVVWLRFQIERGDTGWIRQLDVTPLNRPATPTR